MTLLIIACVLFVLWITYLIGTGIASLVDRRKQQRKKERAEFLDVILGFK